MLFMQEHMQHSCRQIFTGSEFSGQCRKLLFRPAVHRGDQIAERRVVALAALHLTLPLRVDDIQQAVRGRWKERQRDSRGAA
jgi:hypothetical protein